MSRAPVVSVVTPFYNTAEYLKECVESVLAQSFGDFEYLLVNNKSKDGSRDIAAHYAALDPRIRIVDNESFLGQVENYNSALSLANGGCQYVKMVQADDALLPDCLRLMTDVAGRDPRIGIVSSYFMKGDKAEGRGLPLGTWRANGREVLRRMLVDDDAVYLMASPTSVLYRADIVRARKPFFAVGRYHEDTEACYEILLEHDLGFVHQVCSFLRTDNISIMSAARRFDPIALDHLIVLEQYGRRVLGAREFARQQALEWRAYKGFLGAAVLDGRGKEFWDYHRTGLRTIGVPLTATTLLGPVVKQAARSLLNPLDTVQRRLAKFRRNPQR
jgi:glycosyltransferase involved in cell wall biosynthesis